MIVVMVMVVLMMTMMVMVERTEERRTELDVKTCGSMAVERRGVKKCVDEKRAERVLERCGKVVVVDTTVDAAEVERTVDVERTLEMRTEAVGTTTKDEDRTVDAAEDERTDEKWTEGVGMTSEERAVDATEDERTLEKRTGDEGRGESRGPSGERGEVRDGGGRNERMRAPQYL